jgi:hypothetical protein
VYGLRDVCLLLFSSSKRMCSRLMKKNCNRQWESAHWQCYPRSMCSISDFSDDALLHLHRPAHHQAPPTPIPAGPPSEKYRPIEHGLRGRGMGALGVLQTCIVGVANNSLVWASRGYTDSVCGQLWTKGCQEMLHANECARKQWPLFHPRAYAPIRPRCRHGMKSPRNTLQSVWQRRCVAY